MQESKEHNSKGDKKISIALLSSSVILTLQYFILVVFNLFNTSAQSAVQMGSLVIVAIIFIRVFPIVFQRSKDMLIVTYYISLLIFLFQFLLFENNRDIILNFIFPFFTISLLAFIYSYSIKNLKILKKTMLQASYFIFFMGFILALLIISGNAQIDTYSMTLSYYMLLPCIVFLDNLSNKFSIVYLFYSLSSLAIIISLGSRGAIVCVVIFIVLKIVLTLTNLNKKSFIKFIVICILFIIPLLYINYFIEYLYKFLAERGIYSRSLYLFLTNTTYDSGRAELFMLVNSEIFNNPFFGLGIGGDRLILDGSYVHNVILEVLINFGLIIGSLIIILYIIIILYNIFNKKQDNEILLIWFCIGVIPLFLSSSYITDLEFWIFNGLILGGFFNNKKRKTNAL